MTDINLESPPNVTNREILDKARGRLRMVVDYGMGGIPDKIDREHIRSTYDALSLVLDGLPSTNGHATPENAVRLVALNSEGAS